MFKKLNLWWGSCTHQLYENYETEFAMSSGHQFEKIIKNKCRIV